MMDNILSYAAFLKNRSDFRRSGTRTGSEFNIYDTPSHKFFKILFYFWNEDTDGAINHSGGLLAPTWEIYDAYKSSFQDKQNVYYNFDSAWAYLKNNAEDERAEKLEQFVALLSNINSESPWYFSEISGLSEALNRSVSPEFKVEEERKKISIKCLPDAFDNRIETLLSLYRDITWSWANKREIIPANLRKFDMGIYIWESPIYAINTDSVLDELSDKYSSSYKLIEFHNCEFDYNSLKSGYETLTNKEGFANEFTIDIMFDDCYEHTYNSIMMRTIGDVITTDTAMIVYSDGNQGTYNGASREQGKIGAKYNSDTYKAYNELSNRLEKSSNRPDNWYTDIFINGSYFIQDGSEKINVGSRRTLDGHKGSDFGEKGIFSNMVNQVVGKITNDLKSVGNRLLLGNLYTYSISKMANQLKSIFDGNVFTALDAVDEYAGTNIMGGMHKYSLGALAQEGQSRLNDIALDRKTGRNKGNPQQIGKMYDGTPTEQYSERTYINSPYDRTEPSVQMGDIFPTVPKETVKTLGNLNKARTLINNI